VPDNALHRARRPIGAHVPSAGGLAAGRLKYAAAVGAETVQVFAANPRGWAAQAGDAAEDEALREQADRGGIPVFAHAPYLINLGSPDQRVRALSATALRHALARGAQIGARGVVVHTGSAVGGDRAAALRQVREILLPLLDEIPADGPELLLEPTAGQGMLCSAMADLGPYLDALDRHPRANVCLDTCHAFAAGHDLAAPGGVTRTLAELESAAGTGRLRLIHANDSKDGCGSRRDRHENIGAGQIGAPGFGWLLRHPATAGVPFIVETPGGESGHAKDVETLRRLRDNS
jgi:deoxyribonuclease-4